MKFSIYVMLTMFLTSINCCYGQAPAQTPDASGKHNLDTTVDLFAAIDRGTLDVKVVPLGAHKANILLTNASTKPIDVVLPSRFAAVQILGQFGAPGQGIAGQGIAGQGIAGQGIAGQGFGQQGVGGGLGGGAQALGGGLGGGGQNAGGGGLGQLGGGNFGGQFGGNGGFGNGGFGNAGFGGGGGFFRIEPGRTRKLTTDTVCLEHGKRDPNPRLKYALVPLERVIQDPVVAQLCETLGRGQATQNVVQAAVWHHANGLSWETLAEKNRRQSQYTGDERFFSSEELKAARDLTTSFRRSANLVSTSGSTIAD